MNAVVLSLGQAEGIGRLASLLAPYGLCSVAIAEHQGPEPGRDEAQLIVTVAGPRGVGELVDVTLAPTGGVRAIAPEHCPWRRQIEQALGVAA